MKPLRFRPSLREQVKAAKIANDYYAISAGKEPFPGLDMDRIHKTRMPRDPRAIRAKPVQREAPVVAAIAELLAVHPRVLFAVRQNSGMASYEAKSGRYAPVYFYKILTGQPVTITDFWGILRPENGHPSLPFCIEAKRPGWSGPRDEREQKQALFISLIKNVGGAAGFATSVEEARKIIETGR